MKSTNVYSDSTLKDSSVTLKQETSEGNGETKRKEAKNGLIRGELMANAVSATVTRVQRTCGSFTHSPNRTYRPRVDVFLLLAFLFGIQNLDKQQRKQEISFLNKYSIDVLSGGWYCPQIRAGLEFIIGKEMA